MLFLVAELGWALGRRSLVFVEAKDGRRHSYWGRIRTVAVNLSLKNVPDWVVRRLRERAERHRRSVEGELLAIIEAAVQEDWPATPGEILAEVRRLGVRTPSESAALVRADRDGG